MITVIILRSQKGHRSVITLLRCLKSTQNTESPQKSQYSRLMYKDCFHLRSQKAKISGFGMSKNGVMQPTSRLQILDSVEIKESCPQRLGYDGGHFIIFLNQSFKIEKTLKCKKKAGNSLHRTLN